MDNPIGLFDSGFGGLTVMKEVIRLLPNENLIYFGDSANLPYGNKSPERIVQYARHNAKWLLNKGIKMLIIPCHTACCHALEILQNELPIPVVGVIESGLMLVRSFPRAAILGTTSTIASGLYQRQAPNTKAVACPLFVPLIEEGQQESEALKLIAQETLKPIVGHVDAALLACTHYPLMQNILRQVLGPHVQLLEPANACARQAKEILEGQNMLRQIPTPPTYQFTVSDDPERFIRFGKNFLGRPIETVEINKCL